MRLAIEGSKYKTRDRQGLTRAHRAVFEVLKKAANDAGNACITVGDLAGRSGVSRRSVQDATRFLVDKGLLVKIERRKGYDMSEPNIYCLRDRKRSPKKISKRGCKKRMQISHRDSTNLETPCSTSSSADAGCNPVLKEAEKNPHPKRPLPRYRPPKRPPLTRFDRERMVSALKRLDVAVGNDAAALDGDLLDLIDDLRERRIPGVTPQSWGYRATALGAQAWYAVLETVAMMDGLIPREDGGIRSPHAYLGGILWKEKPDPRKTVSDWLEIEQRKEREAQSAKSLEEYRLRQAGFDELLVEAAVILSDQFPEDQIVGFIRPGKIVAVVDETVTIAFPTRFLKEYAWTNYAKPLTAALAKVRGECTAVRMVVRQRI